MTKQEFKSRWENPSKSLLAGLANNLLKSGEIAELSSALVSKLQPYKADPTLAATALEKLTDAVRSGQLSGFELVTDGDKVAIKKSATNGKLAKKPAGKFRRTVLKEEDRKALRADQRAGMSVEQLCHRYNVCKKTVQRVVGRKKPGQLTDADMAKITELRRTKNAKVSDLAKMFGVSTFTIYHRLRRAAVKAAVSQTLTAPATKLPGKKAAKKPVQTTLWPVAEAGAPIAPEPAKVSKTPDELVHLCLGRVFQEAAAELTPAEGVAAVTAENAWAALQPLMGCHSVLVAAVIEKLMLQGQLNNPGRFKAYGEALKMLAQALVLEKPHSTDK